MSKLVVVLLNYGVGNNPARAALKFISYKMTKIQRTDLSRNKRSINEREYSEVPNKRRHPNYHRHENYL